MATWTAGGPENDINHRTKIYENALVKGASMLHMFAAECDDEVVGTAYMHLLGRFLFSSRPLWEEGLAEPGYREVVDLARFKNGREVQEGVCPIYYLALDRCPLL